MHKRVTVDSSFLIRALDPKNSTPEAPMCQQVWRMLLDNDARIVVPAMVVAEVEARNGTRVPSVRSVIVAPFDAECADEIRRRGGMMSCADGRPKGYWKYDVLIAACASVSRAPVLLHIDGGFDKIADKFKIQPCRPDELLTQTALPGIR